MKVFVGNLAAETDQQDLLVAFQAYGTVAHVNIAKDGTDGHSRGFGFVDVSVDTEAREAIAGLNGSIIHGRRLRVNEARRKTKSE